jgi:hypothetical protein
MNRTRLVHKSMNPVLPVLIWGSTGNLLGKGVDGNGRLHAGAVKTGWAASARAQGRWVGYRTIYDIKIT